MVEKAKASGSADARAFVQMAWLLALQQIVEACEQSKH